MAQCFSSIFDLEFSSDLSQISTNHMLALISKSGTAATPTGTTTSYATSARSGPLGTATSVATSSFGMPSGLGSLPPPTYTSTSGQN